MRAPFRFIVRYYFWTFWMYFAEKLLPFGWAMPFHLLILRKKTQLSEDMTNYAVEKRSKLRSKRGTQST